MTPIKMNLNKLIKQFETFVLIRNECTIDFDNPYNLELDYVPDYDEGIPDSESPSYQISINDIPIIGSLNVYKDYIEAAVKEFNGNVKMPMDQAVKVEYLKAIQCEFENLDANIIENDSICISKNAICTNFIISSLEDHLKERVTEYFYRLKHELREVVLIINKKMLEYNIEFDNDSITLPFKRIRINVEINLIATLFYDLLDKNYIDTSKTNLENFMVACFVDGTQKQLSRSTLHTYFKPGMEEKRSSNDKRIHVPPR